MSDFGVNELNIIGSSGTPQVQSVDNLFLRVGSDKTVVIGDSDSDFNSPAPGAVDSSNTTVLNVGIVTANKIYADNVYGSVVGIADTAQNISGGTGEFPKLVVQLGTDNTDFLDHSTTGGQILATNSSSTAFEWVEKPATGITAVKQYSDNADPRNERSCSNPISILDSGSIIGIGSTSNAYGNKFVQSNTPTGICEGDIWYDTSDVGYSGGTGLNFPSINGSDGQVLTSDGTGNVLWENVDGTGGLNYPSTNGLGGQVLTSDGTGNVLWDTVSVAGGSKITILTAGTDLIHTTQSWCRTVVAVVIGGGGGGGNADYSPGDADGDPTERGRGGAGGGGGHRYHTQSVSGATDISYTVGYAGTGAPTGDSQSGTAGGDSIFGTTTAGGGGGGGGTEYGTGAPGTPGASDTKFFQVYYFGGSGSGGYGSNEAGNPGSNGYSGAIFILELA